MKKTLLLLVVAASFLSMEASTRRSWFGRKQTPKAELVKPAPTVFKNDVDTMSYALGVNIASDLLQNLKTLPGGQYNTQLFLEAFNTVFKGDSALFTNEFSGTYLQTFFASAQKKVGATQKAEGEKFLAENIKNPAVQTTPSGLQYIILRSAEGPKPVETDRVKVHYEGTLINGTKFDSSYDRGEPIEFTLNQVISGWTEGVMLMSPGAKYRFFIPYHLAYGENGAGNVIPPFATLIFTVELLEINPGNFLNEIKPLESE